VEKVMAGLGNPGVKYERTRHNVGFMVLDAVAHKLKQEFRLTQANCLVANTADCALLKPLTYMNLSGEALRDWSNENGIVLTADPEAEGVRPLVVCDDLALPLGSLRFRGRGSSGGQNGLASIMDHLGGDEFPRLRLGIAPLGEEVPAEYWADYVLAEFEPEEAEEVAEMIERATEALCFWLTNTFEATSSRFNRRVRPPE
jgi:PTH1 family peptidyl-tRNA hydrolase